METIKTQPPIEPREASSARSGWEYWLRGAEFHPFRRFAIFALVLSLLSLPSLSGWVYLAFDIDLHSYTVLMPVICGYLVWIKRGHLPATWTPALKTSLFFLLAGLGVLAGTWWMMKTGGQLRGTIHTTLHLTAFYFFLLAGCWAFWGWELGKALVFPMGMLAFMIPFPRAVLTAMETGLKYASAEASDLVFTLSGIPVFRDGLFFFLPGLTIEVAQECSGVRSTLVLVITSLLASHLYLRTSWKKAVLVLVTIPLGIFRNAVRIFVLAAGSVYINPDIIHSPLHTHGGPLFFALSLIPLFVLLIVLRRSDYPKNGKKMPNDRSGESQKTDAPK